MRIQSEDLSGNEIASLQDIHERCSRICLRYGFMSFLYTCQSSNDFADLIVIHGDIALQGAPQILSGVVREVEGKLISSSDFNEILSSFFLKCGASVMSVFDSNVDLTHSDNLTRLNVTDSQGRKSVLWLASTIPLGNRLDVGLKEQVTIFTSSIHEGAVRLFQSAAKQRATNVSHRELQCLQWASEGKTNWEIAQILGISQRTVVFHLQNAATKLNTSNRQHTVSQAVLLGIVRPTTTTD